MDRLNLLLGIAFETSCDTVTLVLLICGFALIVTAAGLAAWLLITRDRAIRGRIRARDCARDVAPTGDGQ